MHATESDSCKLGSNAHIMHRATVTYYFRQTDNDECAVVHLIKNYPCMRVCDGCSGRRDMETDVDSRFKSTAAWRNTRRQHKTQPNRYKWFVVSVPLHGAT